MIIPASRLGASRVACAFLVYMLSPLPRRSGWGHCFAHFPQPCQPSPIWLSGRPAHRPFRGLLGVHSRYGLHTRAVTVFRDTLSEGFSHFVSSIAAPVASGWSRCRVGLAPTGKRRLCTAHAESRHSPALLIRYRLPLPEKEVELRLRPTPRSADRARSPARVSKKREYFKCGLETIGDFAPKLFKLGV